jgi:hypothetical protein
MMEYLDIKRKEPLIHTETTKTCAVTEDRYYLDNTQNR